MRKHGIISITLKSDLCTASGYAFGGTVDSDVCYDDCGIPYIQGKRLKGCLRDNAEVILGWNSNELEAVFGKGGSGATGSVRIGNAYKPDSSNFHLAQTFCCIDNVQCMRKLDTFSLKMDIQQ